ncbi:MAG: primosomal protein N' [Actinomycetota bacterium]|nr:primosomal protein N' [Actinomycetota bacterium]MDH5278288.1 primosomal protein N' [Actinomycetota bacterium]
MSSPATPVARVVVDLPLPHLDRTFDYLVPDALTERAVPGCRVRVRFAGQLVSGYLLDRTASSDHTGRLSPLAKVVSSEPVLTPEVARLGRAVADRYAGTLADVLRLAIPPRHAAAEREPGVPVPPPVPPPDAGAWSAYPTGAGFVSALADGAGPRAVWTAAPGPDWPDLLARAVAATRSAGRGAVVVAPDHRDVARIDAALTDLLGPDQHVVLAADLGPKERYRRWLRVLRGQVSAVVGTRAAAFAPVTDLGLVAVWDDGDDLHAEPRAPYPHVREVLALRSYLDGTGLLVGGFARTAEGAALVAEGYARSLVPDRAVLRAAAPRVRAADDAPGGSRGESDDAALARGARLPTLAWRTARDALRDGPVLVQVPRSGYLPAVACARCRTRAGCADCRGPLALAGRAGAPACRWCGRAYPTWSCGECGATQVRAAVVGAGRTAEELGRAFPSVRVVSSGGSTGVLTGVDSHPALVVATPGAEPVAEGGFAAALLLDAWALLDRADLRAGEETLRRWLAAAALVRPADAGGRVVVVADASVPAVQALVRWDPVGFADRELADRQAAGLPPARRTAVLRGTEDAVRDLLGLAELPATAWVLGPVPVGDGQVQAVAGVPRRDGLRLAAALRAAAGVRSARKATDPVSVHIDPVALS